MLPASTSCRDINLANKHSFRFNVRAANFVEIQSQLDIEYLQSISQQTNQLLILSGGTNTVFLSDYDGIIVKPKFNHLIVASEDDFGIEIEVGASVNWDQAVQYCLTQGYHGLENLAGIPGDVGAAPVQNIGAYGVSVSDYITHVTGLWLTTGETQTMSQSECEFTYRNSIFKTHPFKNQFLITAVGLRLSKDPVMNLSHKDVAKIMSEIDKTPNNLFNSIKAIRARKLPCPERIPNAGSFFTNPIISPDEFSSLKQQYPDIPHYSYQKKIKIPAAWMIEQCGWKGRWCGHVGIYRDHALVFIQDGAAQPHELVKLIDQVTSDVQHRFKVCLQPEVVLVGGA